MTAPAALLSSDFSDWLTPTKYVEAARTVLGAIGLDPASSADINKQRVGASVFYDIQANGLVQPWKGAFEPTVWLNPPYGFLNEQNEPFKKGDAGKRSSVSVWMNKMLEEYNNLNFQAGIALVNNTTEASWFQPLWRFPICFTDHRIQFDLPSEFGDRKAKQPTRGNAFIFFCEDIAWCDYFDYVFSQFGHVVVPQEEVYAGC